MTKMTMPRALQVAPNPVPSDSSSATVSWRVPDGVVGQVWISENGGQEILFGEGAEGRQAVDWVQPGRIYDFRLYNDRRRTRLIETVSVSRLLDTGVGTETFGSLRRVAPVSTQFGFDRGQPIDRYYIDGFLQRHRPDIRGRVLEVGESTYTRRFGGSAVSRIDVLHVSGNNPEATIIADLATGNNIPGNSFDCIVLLQTLHLIFDTAAAIRTLHRILKPGGVLLATFPGLSQRSRDEWRDSWYWGFTSLSAGRLFTDVFGDQDVGVSAHGNVLATAAFLYGLASAELTPEELDCVDDCYETLITVRAVRRAIE